MSEPMSSTEIEDVLSSIRRLVSEDLRPSGRMAPGAQPVATGDKLILTPALRVVVDEPADDVAVFFRRSSATETVPEAPFIAADQVELDQVGLDQVVVNLGAAVGPQSAEWEAETGDLAPEATSEGPVAADDWTLPDEPAPSVAPEAAAVEPPEYLSRPETFVFQSAPDSADEILPAEAAPDAIPGWAQEDPTPEDESAEVAAPSMGTLEPDPAWADAAEASVIAALSDAGVEAGPDLPHDDLMPEDDAMLFNEDVLRELVRDILREELAGKMGERITRNIRKLVRAEIARSMAVQEYD
jgi:hypothetical protein